MKSTLIFAFLCVFGVVAEAQAPDSWVQRATSSRYWYRSGIGTIADRIYVFGGGATPDTFEYNPGTNAWTQKETLPIAAMSVPGYVRLESPGSATLNGKIYCIGGMGYPAGVSSITTVSWVFEYDGPSNHWTQRASSLGDGRAAQSCVAINNRVYSFAGITYNEIASGYYPTDTSEIYDPITDSWMAGPTMPAALSKMSAGVINGKAYIAGGWDSSSVDSAATYEFDADAWTWIRRQDMPIAKSGGSSAVSRRRLWVAGGTDGFSNYDFEPITNQWTRHADTTTVMDNGLGAAAANRLFVIGNGYSTIANRCYEYILPDFGAAPSTVSGLAQHLPGESPLAQGATGFGTTMVLEGTLFDADGPQVGLEVEVVRDGQPFTGEPTAASSTGANGVATVTVGPLSPGSYIWRARSFDTNGNESAWVDFSTLAPHFTLTTTPPPPGPGTGGGVVPASKEKAAGCGQSATMSGSLLWIFGAILLGLGRRGVAVGIWALIATTASAQDPDSWTEKSRMASRRCGHASAEAGGKIYVFGGEDLYFYYTPCIQMYDPATDTWKTLADIPAPTRTNLWRYTTGVHFAGNLYQFGGMGESVDGAVWKYEISRDTWTRMTDLPVPLFYMRAAVAGNRIFVTGGRTVSGSVGMAENFEFDPSGSGSWSSKAPMPVGVLNHHMAGIRGKIYVAGGLISLGSVNVRSAATQEYDPVADQWSLKQPMPVARTNGAGVAANHKLFVLGGGGAPGNRAQVYEYSVRSDRWTERTPMPYIGAILQGASSVQIDGVTRIIQTGGTTGFSGDPSDFMTWMYTPPDPGKPPLVPTGLFMKDPLGRSLVEGGLSATSIQLGATLADPDSQVLIEVEVVPDGQPFAGVATASAGPFAPGVGSVTVTGLTSGHWKWHARAVDVDDNESAWADFGDPAIADFVVDATPPSSCSGLSPSGDALIDDPKVGPVHFAWTASTDDRAGLITYEVEVTRGATTMATLAGIGSTQTTITLPVTRMAEEYRWRVRSFDAAGNASTWSAPLLFHVYWNDLEDHGAGDAVKACGLSAPGSGGAAIVLIFALLLLGRVRFN